LTYMFIAHDLAVVEFFADFVAVMYMGRIVEQAASEELYRHPIHPYTMILMQSIPKVDSKRRRIDKALFHEVPSAMNSPAGCPFHPRCPLADGYCIEQSPPLKNIGGSAGHSVACWKY